MGDHDPHAGSLLFKNSEFPKDNILDFSSFFFFKDLVYQLAFSYILLILNRPGFTGGKPRAVQLSLYNLPS